MHVSNTTNIMPLLGLTVKQEKPSRPSIIPSGQLHEYPPNLTALSRHSWLHPPLLMLHGLNTACRVITKTQHNGISIPLWHSNILYGNII